MKTKCAVVLVLLGLFVWHFGNAQQSVATVGPPPPTPELRPVFDAAECYFCNQAMKLIPALSGAFPTYNVSDPNPNSSFLDVSQGLVCDAMPSERDCYPTVEAVARYVWSGYRASVLFFPGGTAGHGMDAFCNSIWHASIDGLCTIPIHPAAFCGYCTYTAWLQIPSLCNHRPPDCQVCPDFGCQRDPQCF